MVYKNKKKSELAIKELEEAYKTYIKEETDIIFKNYEDINTFLAGDYRIKAFLKNFLNAY